MKIISSWDDGAYQDLRLAELLAKYNIPAIFYWPVESTNAKNLTKINRFLTDQDRQEIAKKFEIGGHGITHAYLTRIKEQEANSEIVGCRAIFQQEFNQPILSFCYPRGYSTPNIKNMVSAAGFTSARTAAVGNTKFPEDEFAVQTTVHAGVQRIEYEKDQWLKYALNKLHENPEYYHLFGHSWEIEQNNAWTDLEILLKEIHELL